jgi:hypothetical protein
MGEELDEPIGYLVLPRGTPVVTSDGVTVGKVQKVQHHERERIFDGLVVESDGGRRFVDAPEVAYLTRRKVELLIDSAAFAALPQIGGMLGMWRLRKRLAGG